MLYRRVGSILVTHLDNLDTAERAWYSIHTQIGPVLLGLWYHAPNAPGSHIDSLEAELAQHTSGCVATYLIGDLNIHHSKWLTHSSGNTPQGEKLMDICKNHSLSETVREPTREKYLLDLVLTNFAVNTSNQLLSQIADHKGVLTTVSIPT